MVCWASDSSNSILRISAVRVWIFGSSLLLLEEVKGHSLNPACAYLCAWAYCLELVCFSDVRFDFSCSYLSWSFDIWVCKVCLWCVCQPNPENHVSFQPVILASVLVPPVPCHVMRPLVPHGAVSTVPSAFQNGILFTSLMSCEVRGTCLCVSLLKRNPQSRQISLPALQLCFERLDFVFQLLLFFWDQQVDLMH